MKIKKQQIVQSLDNLHNELKTAISFYGNEISLLAVEVRENMKTITSNQSCIMKELQDIKDTLKQEAPPMDRPTKKLG